MYICVYIHMIYILILLILYIYRERDIGESIHTYDEDVGQPRGGGRGEEGGKLYVDICRGI